MHKTNKGEQDTFAIHILISLNHIERYISFRIKLLKKSTCYGALKNFVLES